MKRGLVLVMCSFLLPNTITCKKISFCGYTITSPIGVSACPLTTSSGIKDLASCGYGVFTYKTIRSAYSPIKSPHLYSVAICKQLTKNDIGSSFQIDEKPLDINTTVLTNAYGINSLDNQAVINDIAQTRTYLSQDQVLIVSIYGSGKTEQEQIDDFVATARIAVAGGAQILEANLSCPNLNAREYVYQNKELVYKICKAITTQLPETPLLIKVGVFESFEQTKEILLAAHAGGAQGVCGINTIPARVVDAHNNPIYGENQPISGISGRPLFSMTIRFIKDARMIIDQEKISFALLATGGITTAEDFDIFLAAGADIALGATHVMTHKQLAQKYHALHTARPAQANKQELIRALYRIGALKIGNFTLKSGVSSPLYFDMRLAISYPSLLHALATALMRTVSDCKADVLCGVPQGAVPLATLMSSISGIPLIMPRKEVKAYGTQKAIEGSFNRSDICLICEDVVSSGASVLETIKIVEDGGLQVTDVVVLVDREQGGTQHVQAHGYRVHALFTISEILQTLLDDDRITAQQHAAFVDFFTHAQIR